MNFFLLIITLLFCYSGIAQESYGRRYYVPKKLIKERVLIATKTPYDSLTPKEQSKIKESFAGLTEFEYTSKKNIEGEDVLVVKSDTINDEFFKKQIKVKGIPVDRTNNFMAYIKFDKSKLIINPFLKKISKEEDGKMGVKEKELAEKKRQEVYYIELKNREKMWMSFTEWTVSSVTIPLKYRFKQEDLGLPEEFSSAVNLNFIVGYSYGEESYTYLKGMDNKSNSWKLTAGLILGASTLKLNSSNTSSADIPLESGNTINQGLVSAGLGFSYSFNKINLGLFYGWDYSVGDAAEKWNYNGIPWLGIGVGYSLFKF